MALGLHYHTRADQVVAARPDAVDGRLGPDRRGDDDLLGAQLLGRLGGREHPPRDRKSTRLNSSHSQISYAVFCLKKKNNQERSCTVFVVSFYAYSVHDLRRISMCRMYY